MIVEEGSTRGRVVAAVALFLLALGLYLPTRSFEFLNYDDPVYVSQNPPVTRGLSLEGLRWAFTFQASNWHPLTWLSHQLDCQLFDLDAGKHHLVNAALHALNAVLLFSALRALTKRTWPAVIVAALFAVHPLRIQSVAWVAERKDLLSSAFFFGLLWTHAKKPSPARHVLELVLMTLGCMAKPMLVTAPFVLLLLDVWPLGRWNRATRARLVLEKLPLLAVAAVSSYLTVLAQDAGGSIGSLDAIPLGARVTSACAGYLAYLRATLWPSGLAVFYPHPALTGESIALAASVGALFLVLGSAAAFVLRRRVPAFAIGWAWFVGMLVPVIGIVQVGDQAWADRYAYLPTIGLYLALVYPLAELASNRRELGRPMIAAALVAVGALATVTVRALGFYRDSKTLFERALAVTSGNWLAYNNLGIVYLERREMTEAAARFREAARVRPTMIEARYNLGLALEGQSEFDEAIEAYQGLLRIQPGHPASLLRLSLLARATGDALQARKLLEQVVEREPRNALAWLALARMLLEEGDMDRAANCAASALRVNAQLDEAELVLADISMRRAELDEAHAHLARAQELDPRSAEAHALLGRWHMLQGHLDDARKSLEHAIELDPGQLRAHYDLGTLLLNSGERDAARAQYQAVLDLRPADPEALAAFGVLEISEGRYPTAIEYLQRALERRPNFALALSNLGVAYERAGSWKDAIDAYERAMSTGAAVPETARALAWILATGPDESLCNGERALELATFAASRQADNALEVLAAAYARQGNFENAVAAQRQVAEHAAEKARPVAEQRLRLYESRQPYTRPR